MEEMLQLKNTITEEAGVISLTNRGDTDIVQKEAKLRALSCGELFIISKLIQSVTVAPALLNTQLV